ncbi:arylsulfatase [Gilvimarinus agarilyticus]|uniref:arylsulfatase n=1 Tax=Gilvimarinus agarilyticus TaxID=679259 RepID=UPI000B124791|nr:arylsulfatase [Gilvimarinus agarilyticus]
MLIITLIWALVAQAATSTTQQPNVLLIMTDDQGWGDVSANGNTTLKTPSIDTLMNQGVRFDRFYASPVCSPTRASVLTGRHSLATGVYSVTRGGEKMFSDEVTLAEHFKQAGYRTGLFGKWHNGLQYPYNPNGQGFDEFYGFADGHLTDYFNGTVLHNQQTTAFTGYLPDRLTDKTLAFMAQDNQPFFAMLSFNTPHSPFELPQTLFDKYAMMGLDATDASVYGMVENIDNNIARLLSALEQQPQLANTIVVFMSDNGPAFPAGNTRYNGGFKGWKGKLDEGGVRVPFALYWPHKLKPKTTQVPGQHIDILPTLLALSGVTPAAGKPIHGSDLSGVLVSNNRDQTLYQRPLFTHHFRNTRRPTENPVQMAPGSLRKGKWAAIVDHSGQWRLYDLDKDPQQKLELSAQKPNVLKKLKAEYIAWYQTTRLERYQPLSIPLGLAQAPRTQLPAHEAEIITEGVDYHFKDGWAHDWLTSKAPEAGAVRWPVEVTRAGRYQITLHYGTPDGSYTGQAQLLLGKNLVPLDEFAPHLAKAHPGKRLAATGEAPTKIWANKTVTANLKQGKGDLILRFSQDTKGRNLEIKGLTINYVAED